MAVRLNLPAFAQIAVKPYKNRHTVALWSILCVCGGGEVVFKGSKPLLNTMSTMFNELKCIQIAVISNSEAVPDGACANGLSMCE